MPKKSNSKKPKPVEVAAAAVVEKEKPISSSKPRKPGNEIDEIFAEKKRKKPEKQEKSSGDAVTEPKKLKKSKEKSSRITKDDVSSEKPCRPRKKRLMGLLYTRRRSWVLGGLMLERQNSLLLLLMEIELWNRGPWLPDQPEGNGKAANAVTQDPGYVVLDPLPGTGQERAFCTVLGVCYYRTLTCPAECPQRKPRQNKKQKGCYIDCSNKCEATCKWRLPRCDGYGSLCYDPRFVGGDGVMFYFHGAKETDFAIVSDDNLHSPH